METRVERIQFGNVCGFLVYNSDAVILIDTGHSSTVKIFSSVLKKLHISPEKLDLIILTHTHFDHAGGARAIKSLCNTKIAVHESEADYLKKGWTPVPKGTRWKGKLISFGGKYLAPWVAKYPSVEPDILIKDELNLTTYGIPGKVIHTPGHTAGSVSIIMDNGIVFMGDNTFGISTKKHYPPFANEPEKVWEAWRIVLKGGAKVIFPAHGKEFDAKLLEVELKNK